MKLKTTRILSSLVLLALMELGACSNRQKSSQADTAATDSVAPKAIVCYFSATGTTAKAAERIADLAGADIHEIAPRQKYTDADLDWRDSLSRSSVEMRNRDFRPQLADTTTDLNAYSIVFLGFPNWWNTAPTIINTFIESNDLAGKTVVPFMTSGGSTIDQSETDLKAAYPSITWAPGLLMNSATDDEVKAWIESSTKK